MTTITSTTSTTAASAAATAIKSLGTGSGIDIKSLANSLVEAERGPRKAILDGRITKSQATISGYAALNYALSQLQKAFADLKDKSDFAASAVTNSQPSAISVSAGASALAGNHLVTVTSVATAQRNLSSAYLTSADSLNSGTAFNLTLGGDAFPMVNGLAQTINVTTATPAGVVAAINAASLGLSAQLINTGATTPYKIMVTGTTGSANSFTIGSPTTGLVFGSTVAGSTPTTYTAITAGHITINGTAIGAVAAVSSSNYTVSSDSTLATTTTTGAAPTTFTAITAGHIIINGVSIGTVAAGTTAITQGANVATAINLYTTKTGVTATANSSTGAVSLSSSSITTAINTTIGATALSANSGLGSTIATSAGSMVTAINEGVAHGNNVAKAINLLTETTGVVAVNKSGAVSLTSGIGAITTLVGSTALTANSGLGTAIATTTGTVLTPISSTSLLQSAANAVLTVDGVDIISASNSVTDAIAGSTLNLLAATSVTASLNFNIDTSSVKTKLQALVTAYNDASQLLTEVSDPKSTLATYGATLVGNSVVATIRNQMRQLVTTESSTKSGSISALRDIGISIDSKGKLAINSVTLDLALKFNYSDSVAMLSGNQQDQGAFDTTAAGVAGDAFKALTTTLSSTGALKAQSDNATKRIANYQDELAKLEDRMTKLLARYIKQFSIMDSLVGQTNSLRTGLTSTFTGMQSIYNNK